MGKWKTEPLKCWGKAKELRLGVYEGLKKASETVPAEVTPVEMDTVTV